MYVCTYVRMYVCTYVLMYVCMYVRMVCTYGMYLWYVRMYMNIPPGPSTTDFRTMYRLLKQCAT